MADKPCFNEREAREYLGCSERAFGALKKTDQIRPLPVLGSYLRADLDRLIEHLRVRREVETDVIQSGQDGNVSSGERTVAGATNDKRTARSLLRAHGG